MGERSIPDNDEDKGLYYIHSIIGRGGNREGLNGAVERYFSHFGRHENQRLYFHFGILSGERAELDIYGRMIEGYKPWPYDETPIQELGDLVVLMLEHGYNIRKEKIANHPLALKRARQERTRQEARNS